MRCIYVVGSVGLLNIRKVIHLYYKSDKFQSSLMNEVKRKYKFSKYKE